MDHAAEHDERGPPPVRVGWEINITTVIAILGALASGAYFVSTSRSGLEQAQKDNVRLETQLVGIRADLKDGLTDIRNQIGGLPDLRANVNQLQQRLGEAERWRTQIEQRINDTRDEVLGMRADVSSIRSASGQQLATPRPPR